MCLLKRKPQPSEWFSLKFSFILMKSCYILLMINRCRKNKEIFSDREKCLHASCDRLMVWEHLHGKFCVECWMWPLSKSRLLDLLKRNSGKPSVPLAPRDEQWLHSDLQTTLEHYRSTFFPELTSQRHRCLYSIFTISNWECITELPEPDGMDRLSFRPTALLQIILCHEIKFYP